MNWQDLHRFWFGDISLTPEYYERQIGRWFMQTYPKFDWVCEHQFAPWLHELKSMPENLFPRDYLALILLFDQIPRNTFRNDKRAVRYDQLAQKLTLKALGTELETSLTLPERMFLYLPLEHSENLKLQELSVEKFFELHKEAPKDLQSWTWDCLDYALEHQKMIKQFGRFTYRDSWADTSSSGAGVLLSI
ncbi:DUF924 family protein [Peredibacter starrii]|uniref:DUF924 family protein n=1 Tax=Peredibacter starrii TaxID=28202 RepID=A0AAX4HVK9_9BACT|nr:DUF924 family protein [Peredibacter starrii]WPU67021.1 DUF924 family protein [Peredibacter starrii]